MLICPFCVLQILPTYRKQWRQTCQTWFPPMTLARAPCLLIMEMALVISVPWVSSSTPIQVIGFCWIEHLHAFIAILLEEEQKVKSSYCWYVFSCLGLWNPLTTLVHLFRYLIYWPKTFISREGRTLRHQGDWAGMFYWLHYRFSEQGDCGWPWRPWNHHREPEWPRYPRGARY